MTLQRTVSKRRVLLLSAVLAVALALFVLSSLSTLNHNDFMYALAPAVWAQNGALYTEVPFPQAPLSIMFNSLLVAASGNVNFFLLGRIVSMLFVLLAVLLPVLNRARLCNLDVWTLYVALCLTSLFVTANSSEIGNYSISLLCLAAALAAFERPGSAGWRGFIGCAAAGLATSAKLYFALLCPALLLYFLLRERAARNPLVIAACAIGFLVGVAPVLFFLARDPQSFLRWNVQIHQMILPLKMASLSIGLVRMAAATLTFALLMSIPIGFLIAATLRLWRAGFGLSHEFAKYLLLAAAFVIAISPVYVYPQYFGPLALLVFLFSAPWAAARDATHRLYVILGGAMFAIQCIFMAPMIVQSVKLDGNLAVAQVLKLQSKARQIVSKGYTCERKFYSAAPLFLLENGVKYPPELAAGPFLMFVRGDGPARAGKAFDLEAHIRQWHPDIAIWGYYIDDPDPKEDAVDLAIRNYALSHAFVVTTLGKIKGHTMQLAYRAGCKASPP